MIVPPDILIVIATLLALFSLVAMLSAWVDRFLPIGAFITLLVALGMFGYAHASGDGLVWQDVPDAFIALAARILN